LPKIGQLKQHPPDTAEVLEDRLRQSLVRIDSVLPGIAADHNEEVPV
jgi:hypothetical protein